MVEKDKMFHDMSAQSSRIKSKAERENREIHY